MGGSEYYASRRRHSLESWSRICAPRAFAPPPAHLANALLSARPPRPHGQAEGPTGRGRDHADLHGLALRGQTPTLRVLSSNLLTKAKSGRHQQLALSSYWAATASAQSHSHGCSHGPPPPPPPPRWRCCAIERKAEGSQERWARKMRQHNGIHLVGFLFLFLFSQPKLVKFSRSDIWAWGQK